MVQTTGKDETTVHFWQIECSRTPEYRSVFIVMPDDIAMCSGVPRNFFRGGGSTNSVEDREDGDLGAVAP